jgi:hypothetical protein
MKAAQPAAAVGLDDIQRLLGFGHKYYTDTAFLLLRVIDRQAACAWLAQAPVAGAASVDPLPQTILRLALTSPGRRALGVPASVVDAFSAEFVTGLGSGASQGRRLGDVESKYPAAWYWGTGERVPHVLVMLYAMPGRLPDWQRRITTECAAGFRVIDCLAGSDMSGHEPFGFADGLSQPELDWGRRRLPRDETRSKYDNLCCLGEFLLGYPNGYSGYTDRPLLDPAREAQRLLPRAEDAPAQADLGRNGSYLVIRQLEQDVAGFLRWLDERAGGDATRRESLAVTMVGRTLDGKPLAEFRGGDLNDFNFDADPDGLRCPIGAHIRRSNPRSADLPPGDNQGLSLLLRTLGLDASARQRGPGRLGTIPSNVEVWAQVRPDARRHDVGGQMLAARHRAERQPQPPIRIHPERLDRRHTLQRPERRERPFARHPPTRCRRPAENCFSMPQPTGPIGGSPGCSNSSPCAAAYFFMPGIRALRYIATAAKSKREDMP